MCYAIPAKILSLEGDNALVDYGGIQKTINHSLINNPKKGDFVLVHAGFAIDKIDMDSAKASLRIIKDCLEWENKRS